MYALCASPILHRYPGVSTGLATYSTRLRIPLPFTVSTPTRCILQKIQHNFSATLTSEPAVDVLTTVNARFLPPHTFGAHTIHTVTEVSEEATTARSPWTTSRRAFLLCFKRRTLMGRAELEMGSHICSRMKTVRLSNRGGPGRRCCYSSPVW